ncbi:MAG: hypothetical protein JWO50_831 [Candidatus Kaiserbacteria bacterium]|nr:hypothetical protein [Candidatus Kaiserbacteria bacterium]
MNIDSLKTEGFVRFNYPKSLRWDVAIAIDAWRAFCALDEKEKRKISGGDRINDFGYMHRNDSGPTADKKEIFHVTGEHIKELMQKARYVHDQSSISFILALYELLEGLFPVVKEFAINVEEQYKIPRLAARVLGSKDTWTIRFVHYYGVGEPVLAKPHTDRGGFTIHMYESHPGGQYLGRDRAWHDWPINHKESILFPSAGLQFLRNELKALCHRVISLDDTLHGGRYSMVGFIDFPLGHRFDDTRFRMQDLPVGFNYDISPEDYRKYFVPTALATV